MRIALGLLAAASLMIAGPVSEASETGTSALDTILANSARLTSAAAFLDVHGCGIDFSKAAGVARRSKRTPARTDMPLRLGSIGKLYSAAVIHALSQRNVVDLDAPASRYLLANDAPGVAGRDATLRQLLNHSSGIPDYYALPAMERWDWRQPLTPQRILTAIKDVPATDAPGSAYAYSNSGYHLLALVAERATGQSFAALVQADVLKPLGLGETQYRTTNPAGALHGYVERKDMWKSAENTGPDSGITASLADVRKFLTATFQPSGRLAAIGRAMTINPIETGKPRQQAGAGAEIRETRDGLRLIGHTGDVEGYLSFAYAVPQYDATIVGHVTSSDKQALGAMLKETVAIVQQACSKG